jgi:large subunit ribosomal protein L7A
MPFFRRNSQMLKQLTEATKHVVGVKQTAKAVEKGTAKLVFIAADADIRISRPLLESCEAAGVKVITADSMHELGKACGIHVGAAAAAVLKD